MYVCETERAYNTYKKPEIKIDKNFKPYCTLDKYFVHFISLIFISLFVFTKYIFFILDTHNVYGFINYGTIVVESISYIFLIKTLDDIFRFEKFKIAVNKGEFFKNDYKDSPIICEYTRDDKGELESVLLYNKNKISKCAYAHFNYKNNETNAYSLLLNNIKKFQQQKNRKKIDELVEIACKSKLKKENLANILTIAIDFYNEQKDFYKAESLLNLAETNGIKKEDLNLDCNIFMGLKISFYFPSDLHEGEDKMKEFCKTIEENPSSNSWLRYLIAEKYFNCFQQHKKALKYINEAIRLNDTNGDYFITKGKILFRLRKYDEAINEFLKAEELTELNHEDLAQIAITYDNKGDCKNAIIYANKALKIKKNDGDALYAKGIALQKMGRHQEAYELYKKVKKIGCTYTRLDEALGKLSYLENAEHIMKKDIF